MTADVCRALTIHVMPNGQVNTTMASQKLRSDESGFYRIKTPIAGGGLHSQKMRIVNESGLYRLMMRSDKPQARPFQDWVTRVVLPTIRKEGAYVMGEEKIGDPDASLDDLDALSDRIITLLRRKSEVLEKRLASTDSMRTGTTLENKSADILSREGTILMNMNTTLGET